MSKDGLSIAVAAGGEDSNALGLNGDQTDNSSTNSSAVYVYTKIGASWAKTSFLKAPNTGSSDQFGVSVTMDETGTTLVIGAGLESSNATGVSGSGQANNGASSAGAVYL